MPSNNSHGNEFEEVMFRLFRLMREQEPLGAQEPDSMAIHLSIVQLHALTFLKKNGSTQMSDIAEYFHIEKSTATSLLDKLVKLKVVKRIDDKKDRRVVHIELTEKGEQFLQEAVEQRSKKINLILSYLSKKDREALLMLLGKIVDKMDKERK